MKLLLHPAYFPNIATYAAIARSEIVWETHDNYQKQTYRNRCHICTDIGKHLLTIPIKHTGSRHGRQKYRDVRIDNSYRWQRLHWRTLQTAYRTSAFFEFYEDDLAPLYEKKYDLLMEFNFASIQFLNECLGIQKSTETTEGFVKEPLELNDARFLIDAKQHLDFLPRPYFQVFQDRNDFVANISTLDLLFNEGTNALTYLKGQTLDFLNA